MVRIAGFWDFENHLAFMRGKFGDVGEFASLGIKVDFVLKIVVLLEALGSESSL